MENVPLQGTAIAGLTDQPEIVASFSFSEFQALLQAKGYRVEPMTDDAGGTQLRSATGGFPFYVRGGNRAGADDRFIDVTLYAGLRIQGEFSPDILNRWNSGRRFSRLQRSGEVLVLEMDVSAVAGVTIGHLQAMIEIWDRLVHELLRFLREGAGGVSEA